MKTLTMLFGVFVAVVGLVGVSAPSALVRAADYLTTPIGLYAAAAFRIGIGIVLVLVAPSTRAPKPLRVFGAIIVIAGIITAFVGVDRARAMVAWEAAQGTTFIRMAALLAVAVGGFILFAVTGRRTA